MISSGGVVCNETIHLLEKNIRFYNIFGGIHCIEPTFFITGNRHKDGEQGSGFLQTGTDWQRQETLSYPKVSFNASGYPQRDAYALITTSRAIHNQVGEILAQNEFR